MSDEVQTVSVVRDTAGIVSNQQLGDATSLVQYVSDGHCLIIGAPEQALSVADAKHFKGVTIVEIKPDESAGFAPRKQLLDSGVALFTVPALHLGGHLGAFNAIVPRSAAMQESDFDIGVSVYLQSGLFDLVLDLSEHPVLDAPLPPFGYQHARTADEIDAALEQLRPLTGEFDKPRYFDYRPAVCAHSRSELEGCTRCIDVCAAQAIVSDGEGVTVNPFLCQGCGSCATLCPTGAMSYAYPRPSDAIERSRQAMARQSARVLLLHTEAQQPLVEHSTLHEAVLPMLVEEVSAFGVDYWLSMIAGHASRIVLLCDAQQNDGNYQALQQQINMMHELLAGLGIDEQVVSIITSDELASGDAPCLQASDYLGSALNSVPAADFSTHNDKRQTIRLALDTLAAVFTPLHPAVELSASAPFGRVDVDKQACTLCMACVSTCPAKALLDGQEAPALRFVEANCVQCGLCEQACPESAISLRALYTWDSVDARRISQLNNEDPFHCLQCHKPFTTKSMIQTMSAKLAGHWMFQDEKAIRRLKLCGDCRVRDLFEQDNAGIDVHKTQG